MKRILITGKSSFVGGAIRDWLARFPGRYRVEQRSLRGDAWRREGFAGFDCVIHAAGIAHVQPRAGMDDDYFAVNRDLAVEAAQRAKADGVGQFILLSSLIVYGEAAPAGRHRMIDANTKPAPVNAYGQSKLEAEQGVNALAGEGFRVAVLRPPIIYGPGCKGNYNALSRFGRRLPAFPRFDNARSLLFVGNLAECVRRIIDGDMEGTFFPQDRAAMSVTDIVAAIARARGRRMVFTRLFNPLLRLAGRRGVVRRAFGDMAYDPALSARPEGYRLWDSETAIALTESGANWAQEYKGEL